MATVNDVVITVRWIYDAEGNRPEIVDDISQFNIQWQDITGQQANPVNGICKTEPNVYLIRVQCTNPRLTEIQNHQFMRVLAARTWDHTDPDTILTNNFDDQVDQSQADAFVNFMQNLYGLSIPAHLTDQLGQVIEAGVTRRQIIERLADKWRGFLKASS